MPDAANSLTATFAALERERSGKKTVPRIGNFFGAIYVAITTIILAYGSLFGFASILLMYAIWLPKLRYKGTFTLKLSKDVIFAALLPALGVISTLWSDFPKESLYSSLEYTSLVVCAVLVGKLVRTPAYIRGLVIGSTLVLAASLFSGTYGTDPFSGTSALIGLFGSKNMVGFFAEISILSSVISLFMRQNIFEKILFALIPLLVAAASIYLSKSASSLLSAMIVLATLAAAVFITKLPRAFRMPCTIAGGIVLFLFGAAATIYGLQNTVLKSFNKDTTLTGRTYLWSEGLKAGMESPVLGHGYSAFWVEGRPKAEELWEKFYVPAKVGFHFHNMFIEAFVELGFAGALLVAWMLIGTCFKSIRLAIAGLTLEYTVALAMSVMFLCRAMVEVDIIGTFSIGPLLFYSIVPRLATYKRERQL